MSDTQKPIIIKAYPNDDESGAPIFYAELGRCITQWAFVDRQLFMICQKAMKLDNEHVAFFYYRQRAFNYRLRFTDEALKAFPSKGYPLDWKDIHKRLNTLAQTRNVIAHQPAKIVGASDGVKAVYKFSIYIEPFSVALDGDHVGLQGKKELVLEDLTQHKDDVATMVGELAAFRESLAY